MRNKLTKKLLSKQAIKIKNKKKRGIKDEWQILNSGKLKEVGNDTRNVYNTGLNTVLGRCWTYAHPDVFNTYGFARRNATDIAPGNGRGISGFPRTELS